MKVVYIVWACKGDFIIPVASFWTEEEAKKELAKLINCDRVGIDQVLTS